MSSGPTLTPAYHSALGQKKVHHAEYDVAHRSKAMCSRSSRGARSCTTRTTRARNLCVSHHGDKVQLSIDFPGVKAADLSVRVENRVLSVHGIRYIQTDHGGVQGIELNRRFHLDGVIDSEYFEAKWSHGVLSLIAPLRRKSSQPITIPITSSSDAPTMDTSHSIIDVDAIMNSGEDDFETIV